MKILKFFSIRPKLKTSPKTIVIFIIRFDRRRRKRTRATLSCRSFICCTLCRNFEFIWLYVRRMLQTHVRWNPCHSNCRNGKLFPRFTGWQKTENFEGYVRKYYACRRVRPKMDGPKSERSLPSWWYEWKFTIQMVFKGSKQSVLKILKLSHKWQGRPV